MNELLKFRLKKISIMFFPADFWIGVFFKKEWHNSTFYNKINADYFDLYIYICILPMLPIRLVFTEYGKDIRYERD